MTLRWVLGEPGSLPHPSAEPAVVTSRITSVAALRTLDRLRRQGRLSERAYAERHGITVRLLGRVERAHVHAAVLRRAAEPFPTPLGTLDAVHLATALLFRDIRGADVTFGTHDVELATAARAVGLETVGV